MIIFFLTKNYHVFEKFLTECIILRWGGGGGGGGERERGGTEMHARHVFKAARHNMWI